MLNKNILSSVSILALSGILLGIVPTAIHAMEEFESEAKTASISLLPNEVMIDVFSYLSPKALSRVATVSKLWAELSSDGILWKPFLTKLGFKIPNDLNSKSLAISMLKKSTVSLIVESGGGRH